MTTHKDTLLELATRCEQATGPDHSLDTAIAFNLGLDVDEHKRAVVKPYTASLDAAMTLVPEGWLLQLSDWQHTMLRERGPWQALLSRDRDKFDDTFAARCDHAATPALALCAASLRARAAQ